MPGIEWALHVTLEPATFLVPWAVWKCPGCGIFPPTYHPHLSLSTGQGSTLGSR